MAGLGDSCEAAAMAAAGKLGRGVRERGEVGMDARAAWGNPRRLIGWWGKTTKDTFI